MDRFVFRTGEFLHNVTLELRQTEDVLGTWHFRKLIPNHWFSIDGRWLRNVRPGGGPVHASLHS